MRGISKYLNAYTRKLEHYPLSLVYKTALSCESGEFTRIFLNRYRASISFCLVMEVAKACCYLGASLSGLIAHKLNGMPDKSFLNKMFLFYFAVDCIMGTLNTSLLFNVKLKRFDMT